jgi:hypothetical protein
MRSLRYLNGGAHSPFPAEPEQLETSKEIRPAAQSIKSDKDLMISGRIPERLARRGLLKG